MNFKRILELAQDYVEPDPLEQVSIKWPASTWLQRRRRELASMQAKEANNERGDDNGTE